MSFTHAPKLKADAKKCIIIHLHDSLSQLNSAQNEEQHSFQA